MRHNLTMHMLHDADSVDALAIRIHTVASTRAHFRSKPISRAVGLAQQLDLHRGPLLLVWGEHDVTAVPDQVARSLSQGREQCRTQVIPGAGHWVQYEGADVINRLLMAWLGEMAPEDRQ